MLHIFKSLLLHSFHFTFQLIVLISDKLAFFTIALLDALVFIIQLSELFLLAFNQLL